MREAFERIYCHRDLIQTESLGPVPRSLHSVSQGSILLASHVSLKEVRRQLYVSCKTLL